MNSKHQLSFRRLTMLLEGLILLQPLYLGINSPYFTIRRFKIPDSSVDLYITKINITMQLGFFVGLALSNLYFYALPRSIQRFNSYLSVVTNWLTTISSTLLLFSYVIRGDEGFLSFYYFMLTTCSFLFGVNEAFVMNVGVSEIPCFTASIPASGLLVVSYQFVFNKIALKLGLLRIEFVIIICQITMMIFMSGFTSVLWMLSYLNITHDTYEIEEVPNEDIEAESRKYYDPEDLSFFKRVNMSKYAFISSAVGLGYLYGCYPAIVPYKLAELREAYYIDLLIIFLTSLLTFLVCVLCEYTRFGPNKNWKATNSKWVYALLLIFPYLLLPIFFVTPLHYPDVSVFKLVLNNKYFMAFLGIAFSMMGSFLMAVGYSASSKQTNKENDSDMAPLNVLIAYVVLIVVILYSQGYLTFYSMVQSGKASVNSSNVFKSFFFWVGKSFVYGWKTFKTTFTTDIKSDILQYKE